MKKLGILAFAAFLMVGLVSCSEKEGDSTETNTEETTNSDASANTQPATDITNPVTEPANDEPELPVTTVEFTEDSHNFGEIKEGEKVSHVFKFKNTGDNPLKLTNVKPSCGCTTPDWSREEVAPGEEGFVKVEFDSKGKTGVQKKSVTVTANTEPKAKILTFSGEVVPE